MKNPRKFILAILTAMCSMTAFAQSTETKSFQKRVDAISLLSNKDKLKYLESFLNDVKINPAEFSASSKLVRDSVRNEIQIEYNIILLAIFSKGEEKGSVDVKKSMSKAFADCIKLLTDDKLTKEKQDRLDRLVENTKDSIKKYGLLAEGDFGIR